MTNSKYYRDNCCWWRVAWLLEEAQWEIWAICEALSPYFAWGWRAAVGLGVVAIVPWAAGWC
jgi:hypothetical protein